MNASSPTHVLQVGGQLFVFQSVDTRSIMNKCPCCFVYDFLKLVQMQFYDDTDV